jgi:pathogenesis-related protein 1
MMRAMLSRTLLLALALTAACGASGAPAGDSSVDEPSSRGSSGSAPSGMDGILEAHNRHRAAHCAPPLAWSDELADVAQGWADQLAKRGCAFDHSSSKYGENLAAGSGSMAPDRAAELWYDERKHHDYKRGGFSMKTGHFTQLVWVGSQRLGCGTTTCKGKQIWVCNYDPPGNVQGQFATNVLPTTCRK